MMTTNDCGHPLSAEDSVLRCAMCEGEELTRRDDATWNAAIEAAAEFARESARRVRAETEKLGQAHSVIGETCAKTLESFDTNMRSALKRGQS